jgi:hypothetical protein
VHITKPLHTLRDLDKLAAAAAAAAGEEIPQLLRNPNVY